MLVSMAEEDEAAQNVGGSEGAVAAKNEAEGGSAETKQQDTSTQTVCTCGHTKIFVFSMLNYLHIILKWEKVKHIQIITKLAIVGTAMES